MVLSVVFLLALALADDPRFVDAQQRFAAFDYEGALTLLDALGAEATTTEDRVRVLIWSGTARALLGDDGAARSAFEAALLLDRSATFERDTSPKVRTLFDDVRRHLPPEPTPPTAPAAVATPATVAPAPTPTPPTTTPTIEAAPVVDDGVHWLVPTVGASAGVAGLVVAGVAGLDAFNRAQVAAASSTSQVDAVANANAANTSIVVASIAGGVGVALLAAAGVSLLW